MKRLFRKSKWIHKYFGLILILFLIWMSFSGILLNHPRLISRISLPGRLVPPQYHIQNWDRSALITMKFSRKNPGLAFAAGKQGIWKTADGGRTFTPLNPGRLSSRYYRKTNSLLLWEGRKNYLFAGTDGGLFVYDLARKNWRKLPLGPERERVVKILRVKDGIVAFTPSHVYRSPLPPSGPDFRAVKLQRPGPAHTVSLVRLFFDLHDGKFLNLAGRLLFDAAGLLIIFLGITAFYIWYFPWKRKRTAAGKKAARSRFKQHTFRLFYKYHLKLGIWAALFLFIIGGTGFFMRPPVLAVIANGSIPAGWYPGLLPENPWDEKIHNALYDAQEGRLIIEATDGFWSGPADFKRAFVKREMPAPVFVMGATVLEPYGTGGYLIGSFNGIFHQERTSGRIIDMLTGREVRQRISPVRPADKMVTGYFKTPEGEEFITTHEQGLLPLGGAQRNGRFQMPASLEKNYRMPLWNYMFELHNGRIFKDLIGGIYILMVPLGSLLFVLITLSGIYDWLYLKVLRKRIH